MGGENNANVENVSQTKKEVTCWDAFGWIKTSHWYNDFLKWMLLVLCEPKDSPEENNIETGLKDLREEIGELCNVTNANPDLCKFVSGLFEKCNNWRSLTREEDQKYLIMKEIVIDTLRLESSF